MHTAINLFSVRELDETMHEILDRVTAAGYDGVQFSGGLRGATPEAVREMLNSMGLSAVPAHIGIGQLESHLDDTATTYGELIGCDGAVIPALGKAHFASRDTVDAVARRLSALGAQFDDLDWQLHYHNHDFEFVDLGSETAFEHLLEQSSNTVQFELDVGWALAGGRNPADLLTQFGTRIDLVHMKDVDLETHSPCEVGEGDVDMQACANAARDVDATWLIYEYDTPEAPAKSIDTGAEYLESL